MITNLHTHTYRCRHASGTEREYIENAVAAGLKRFGFSDHSPAAFPGTDYYSGFRMLPEEQADYVETVLRLREEYAGVIDIRLGYEIEYYPRYFEDFMKLITRYPVDYLLLGQHFIGNEVDSARHSAAPGSAERLHLYVDQVIEALDLGIFTYLAHPDLVHFDGHRDVFDEEYTRLIRAAMDRHIPLEINLLGIRDHRDYPQERFFELCGQLGAPVCFGCDAHSADVAVDTESYEKAKAMAARYGSPFIEDPVLIPVKF